MAALDRMVKKGFIRYTKENYPDEAEKIIRKAEEIFPMLYAKAPDIGGKENAMSYNLDMMIMAASFYEASDHRIDGEAILKIAREMFSRFKYLGLILNANNKRQMAVFRSLMYKKYVPYAKLVEEKLAKGEWGNTWRVKINPRNTDEGVCFDLVGCPLADFARENGYNALPYADNSFDAVLIANALHIVPDLQKALGEIGRVLRSGGLLIAPNFVEHRGTLSSRIWSGILRIAGVRFEHQWTAAEYLAFLEENGWHVTFSRELAARIALMYTECERVNEGK